MKNSKRPNVLLALAAPLALSTLLHAQEPEKPEEKGPEPKPELQKPEITYDDLWPSEEDPQAAAQQEMVDLFARVERRLRAIDSILLDASAGDTTQLDELLGSGMEDLIENAPDKPEEQESSGGEGSGAGSKECKGVSGSLGQSTSQARQAVQEIDRIIEIAQSMPSNCQSGAPREGSDKPGQSPVDKPQGSRDKSQSPEKPREDGEQSGQQPKEPKDNKSSDDDGRNEPAQRTPGSETENPPQVTDQREQWGDLPVHVRDVFRAEGGPGMPAQYRDWIDAYYRRLNSRSGD